MYLYLWGGKFLFGFVFTEAKAKVLHFSWINKDMKREVIEISFPISAEPSECEYKWWAFIHIKQSVEQWFRTEGSRGLPKGTLFQLQLQLHAPTPLGLQSTMKKIAAGASTSRMLAFRAKILKSHLQPVNEN